MKEVTNLLRFYKRPEGKRFVWNSGARFLAPGALGGLKLASDCGHRTKRKAYMSIDEDRGGSSPDRSPNDDRSDVMNPNNPDYDADQANRDSQGGHDD